MAIARFAAAIIFGYIFGSIPWGVIMTRRFARVDVRNYGSGKMGGTNVLRVAGLKMALLVILLDIAKGAAPVLAARAIIGHEYLVIGNIGFGALVGQCLAALAAIAGHVWPVFLKFHGGRGVSTFFGGLIAMCPLAAVFGGEMLIISAGLTRFASIGSLVGAVGTYAILIPLTVLNGFPIEYIIYTFLGTVFLAVMHRDNIMRLLAGTERKLGEKIKAALSSSKKETE